MLASQNILCTSLPVGGTSRAPLAHDAIGLEWGIWGGGGSSASWKGPRILSHDTSGPIYTESQRQCSVNAVNTLATQLSLKRMGVAPKWVVNPF